jgi:hypothetical protein
MVNEALQLWVFVCNNNTYFHSSLYKQFNHPRMTEDQTGPHYFTCIHTAWLACAVAIQATLNCDTKMSRLISGPTQSPTQLVLVFPPNGVKWPGCEKTTHLHYGGEVKNVWSCISTLAICLYNTDLLVDLLLGPLLNVHIHILSLGVK